VMIPFVSFCFIAGKAGNMSKMFFYVFLLHSSGMHQLYHFESKY
jgi:hypothetical protein